MHASCRETEGNRLQHMHQQEVKQEVEQEVKQEAATNGTLPGWSLPHPSLIPLSRCLTFKSSTLQRQQWSVDFVVPSLCSLHSAFLILLYWFQDLHCTNPALTSYSYYHQFHQYTSCRVLSSSVVIITIIITFAISV